MATINQLTSVSSLSAGDNVPIYDSSNGDSRKFAISLLTSYLQSNLNFTDGATFTTQYAAPSATAFSVSITGGNYHLILTPTAGFAAGTIVLPALTSSDDGDRVLVNCTQAVTTLTIDGNGATVTGGPTALMANDYFTLKYDAPTQSWYRVG